MVQRFIRLIHSHPRAHTHISRCIRISLLQRLQSCMRTPIALLPLLLLLLPFLPSDLTPDTRSSPRVIYTDAIPSELKERKD